MLFASWADDFITTCFPKPTEGHTKIAKATIPSYLSCWTSAQAAVTTSAFHTCFYVKERLDWICL